MGSSAEEWPIKTFKDLDEAGADVEEYKEAVYKKRDPYGDHRDTRKAA
jgi:hypothetical protein